MTERTMPSIEMKIISIASLLATYIKKKKMAAHLTGDIFTWISIYYCKILISKLTGILSTQILWKGFGGINTRTTKSAMVKTQQDEAINLQNFVNGCQSCASLGTAVHLIHGKSVEMRIPEISVYNSSYIFK